MVEFKLKNIIFNKYFLPVLNIEDPNKDVQGKGTLQRYIETLAEDWDNTVVGVIEKFIDNMYVPATVKNKFIPYLEKQMGIDEPIHPSLEIRRRVLSRITEINKRKGTESSYKLIFNALGFADAEVLDANVDYGFDSTVTLNNEVRTFDLGRCHKCQYYVLNLTGSLNIDSTMMEAINNAIDYVEPIYAKRLRLVYNEVDVNLFDIFIQANGDLIYNSSDDGVVGFTLAPNGDLTIYGSEAANYTLDNNGNLTYNNG